MDIEQISPKQPNFGLVVGLFCATLLIVFVLALFFVHFDGKHLTFRHHSAHPTSLLVLPVPANPSPATLA
jgi:RsiW-degrading membrane proteinase PrsW (M82 family)